MPEVNHLQAINLINQALDVAKIQTEASLVSVRTLQSQILTSLGFSDYNVRDIDTKIQEKITRISSNQKLLDAEDPKKLEHSDLRKLEKAERLAAITRGLLDSWTNMTHAQQQTTRVKITALQAQIDSIRTIASAQMQPEILDITTDLNQRINELSTAPAQDGDSSEVNTVVGDDLDDATSAYSSEVGDKNDDALPNKLDAQYELNSDTTGVRMRVTVKDNKTKIRIPRTEGLELKDKISLAHDFVKAALLEKAYKLDENDIPTFTLKTQDLQFREAVRAQIKLLGYKCETPGAADDSQSLSNMIKSKLGLSTIEKEVLEYNQKVLKEHKPVRILSDAELQQFNKDERKRIADKRPDPDLQEAFFNSIVRTKSEERAKKDSEGIAPPSTLNIKYNTLGKIPIPTSYTGYSKVSLGQERIAKHMGKDLESAKDLVNRGFASYNYSAETIGKLQKKLEDTTKKITLKDLEEFGIDRAETAAKAHTRPKNQ